MLVKERAILLAKTKYGEADLILKFISSKGDIFSAIARSALKSKKRFGGGVLEPTHYISVTVEKHGANSERLPVLTEAQIIDDFRGLKTDYDRLQVAFHFVKAVSTVASEGELHKDIFNLIGHALKVAETSKNLPALKLQFNLKMLHLQGVLPPEERFAPYLRASIREADEFNVNSAEAYSIGRDVEMMFQSYVT
jgi:DNA repair protein RecO (recombination protein O)